MYFEAKKPKRAPGWPGVEAQRIHDLTHIPYQEWCDVCVKAKAKSNPHKAKIEDVPTIPSIEMSYMHLSAEGEVIDKEKAEADESLVKARCFKLRCHSSVTNICCLIDEAASIRGRHALSFAVFLE